MTYEFDKPPVYTFHCRECGTTRKASELFLILVDGYKCQECGAFYTFDEVHGHLEN